MEVRLPKDMLKKAIKRVAKVLEKKSSIIHEKLQSQVSFFCFTAKVVCLGRAFLWRFYNALARGEKYLH